MLDDEDETKNVNFISSKLAANSLRFCLIMRFPFSLPIEKDSKISPTCIKIIMMTTVLTLTWVIDYYLFYKISSSYQERQLDNYPFYKNSSSHPHTSNIIHPLF
ncbi:hypothetical protein KFK09_017030 [Dendrobium nobile]|uniref:Uncharacterized protein n=1 Tax=Dendrobium nobile TaxID=94219 RepID=A0A8T3B1D9_DENNO|nr:hypothetical protein KFK09_017030 [Dendrobium nobile]